MNTPASPPQNETPTAEASPVNKATLDGLNEHLTKAAENELSSKVLRIIDRVRDAVRTEIGLFESEIAICDLSIGCHRVGPPGAVVTGSDLCRAIYTVLNTGAKERYASEYKQKFVSRIAALEKRLEETQAELQNLRDGGGQ